MKEITSVNNKVIKYIRSLDKKKQRSLHQTFIIEGKKMIFEALRARWQIEMVLIEKNSVDTYMHMLNEYDLNYEIYLVGSNIIKSVSSAKTPQGIIAVVKMKDQKLTDHNFNNSRFVLLEELQDPGNVGTIIRTIHAADFDGVIMTPGCVDIYNPKTLRATMGSIFHVPIFTDIKLQEAGDILHNNNICMLSADLKGQNIYKTDLYNNICICIGNEGAGISDRLKNISDLKVSIPMPGEAESLNASIAAGILIYESVRQRLLKI